MQVAILGSTGAIGLNYQRLLKNHPWFTPVPVRTAEEALAYPLIFSALPTDIARNLEHELVQAGARVISSASAHRQDPTVPLVIPEINAQVLLPLRDKHGWLVAKPNCTVHTFMIPLAPLHQRFGVQSLHITSMQALSGAGKKGLEDPRLKQSVSTWIDEEEEKCIREPLKIWDVKQLPISAQCNRVPVTHGHVVSVSVAFKQKPLLKEILEAWQSFSPLNLPSSAHPLIHYHPTELPTLQDKKMAVYCSRLQPCPHFHYRFMVGSHNLIRGGAGAGSLTAEYLYKAGFFA
jgi:aspartate-semialdehyde dehydrogenase